MKTIAKSLLAGLATCLLTVAAGAEPKEQYAPGLGEIMLATQTRHAKLWFAGRARNWDLAGYEIDELKEGLEDAAKYFSNEKGIPIGKMINEIIMPAIGDAEGAIKTHDRAKFSAAYGKLTAACNACHQGAKHAYVVIQQPGGGPFPNQSFRPR